MPGRPENSPPPMEDTFKFLGIVCFAYGVLWHSAILKEARGGLSPDQLIPLQDIHRLTIVRDFGPILPLMLGIVLQGAMPQHSASILVGAVCATVALLVFRGWVRARSLRGAGLPSTYLSSYRKAYAIKIASLSACAIAFMYPALQAPLA